eukprot:1140138-Pelagomonas_calceolata.AAC.1
MQCCLAADSCSSPYNVSVETGDTVDVKDIDTCKQSNSNDGLDFEPSLSSRDFVIFLESSSVERQIFVSSKSAYSSPASVQVVSQQCSKNQTSDTVVSEESSNYHEEYLSVEGNNNAQNAFIAAANTSYFIIYETKGECGSGEVTIEAPVQYSCSSPYAVSMEIGDSVDVDDIDTCKQGNSNNGLALNTSLSSRDFVILLESSEVARQISVSSTSTSSNSHSVQVISQQCSINQTSDTVVSEDRTAPATEKTCLLAVQDHLSVEGGFNDPAQNNFIAAANTSYFIIYETEGGCGSGKVTIEALTPPGNCEWEQNTYAACFFSACACNPSLHPT